MRLKNLVPMQWHTHSEPVHYNSELPFFAVDYNVDKFFNHLNRNFFNSVPFDFHPDHRQNRFPKVDITETNNEFMISAELPGMCDKDIAILLDDGTLTLKGEKKIQKEDERGQSYSRERYYGAFQRSFKVPESIDQNKIDASFNKGLLTVKLPKIPELKKKVKKIAISH